MSKRTQQRRPLFFENLEGKTSPTPLPSVGWVESNSAAEVASTDPTSDESFLLYIGMIQAISIERAVPTDADSNLVDQMIVSSSPD